MYIYIYIYIYINICTCRVVHRTSEEGGGEGLMIKAPKRGNPAMTTSKLPARGKGETQLMLKE